MGIQNPLCKATVTHSESHTRRAQWVCSEAEKRVILIVAVYEALKAHSLCEALGKCLYK